MIPLKIPLEEFIKPFFEPKETVCLRIFADRKGSAFKGLKLETTAGSIGSMQRTLDKNNAENRGIFFVVNFGGHEDKDITRINAQFVECDDLALEEQYKKIKAFSIEPSIIVKTRKSLHTYWLIKNGEVAQFRDTQKALIQEFHGDNSCINESRVLRLPNFYHHKEDPIMVECIKFNPELRYTQEELKNALPKPLETPVPSAMITGTRRGLAMVVDRCDFISYCRENAENLSEHDWYAMITNLAVFEGGDKAIHEYSKAYGNYNYDETQNKINHFLSSNTKPMTCRCIAEKGYKCLKIGTGGCKSKAPAGLCYQALNVTELRQMLFTMPVKNAPVEDIGTASKFISQYLYNIESVVAETFISYELKSYFTFRATDIKPLLSLHKDIYKQYLQSKDTKREMMSEELPDWYEPTERGGLRFVAGVLAKYMAENVHAFYGAESYYIYENGVYNEKSDLIATAKVREFLKDRYATMSGINDAEGQWKMLINRPVREINCNPFIINVKNGLYNILDDSFKPHNPQYLSTVQINATYTPEAKCPEFLKFLESMLPKEEIKLIQEILGYLLIPVNKAQKSFVFVGAANAGKSTLLAVAQEILLGSSNVSNIPWQSLADRFKTAELFGKLANIFADLPSKNVDDNGIFKALTGEDYVIAERKNKNPFSFKPYARLLFSCNEIPKNYGDRSDGFYRRLIIIRFDKSVPASKRDANLREKLAIERDGILMWAMKGLKRLIDQGYNFSETDRTKAELQRYKVESNSVLSFAQEFCEIKESATVFRDDLFTRYKEYCINAGLKPVSQTNFNKEIENSDQSIKRGRDKLTKRRTWENIGFVEGGNENN